MSLLEVTDLRTDIRLKKSTMHVIDGVDFTVDTGKALGIVGESGCGKTLTALSVMRLLPAGCHLVSGRILLGGRDLAALPESELSAVRGNDIGVIFQSPATSLNPTMTVGRQISESVRIHRGVGRREAHERAVEALALVGMPSPARRALDYPHQLSGGMRQRAMIAMALANEPRLLIADEPTTALDATVQKQILELIDDLRQRLAMAVILVSHDLGVIAGHADKVAVMYAGRIVEYTSTERLYRNPRHPYTEALFRALPERVVETGAALYSIPGLPPDLSDPPAGCRFAARCEYAQSRCRQEDPRLSGELEVHRYACWYPTGASEQARSAAPHRIDWSGGSPAASAAARDGEPLLVVDNVTKEYPVTKGAILRRRVGAVSAVSDVSFAVRRSETFGLVGESGCGKSTVGRLVTGLEQPDAGSIRFDGQALRGRRRGRDAARVQLMFQDSYAAMNPRMRALSLLREPLDIQSLGNRTQREARVHELLRAVGLSISAAERFPHEFSGGQLQRVGLARALALKPALIVADEPVSALDVSIQSQVLNLMRDLQRESEVSYLLISHNLAVVRYLADRVGVMYLGKLVEIGPTWSVCSRPVHHYTRGLLDSVAVAEPGTGRDPRQPSVSGEPPSAIDPPSGCRFRTRCPAARERCALEEPLLRDYGDGHRAACHFPLRGPSDDIVAENTSGDGFGSS